MKILVDSNVLLDIFTEDKTWFEWSSSTLSKLAENNLLAINPIIYAELSPRFPTQADLDKALPHHIFQRLPLPWAAGFLAGQRFLEYKRRGGNKLSPLPDFYIGAHAIVEGLTLLTRDTQRYQHYFPKLQRIIPEKL